MSVVRVRVGGVWVAMPTAIERINGVTQRAVETASVVLDILLSPSASETVNTAPASVPTQTATVTLF